MIVEARCPAAPNLPHVTWKQRGGSIRHAFAPGREQYVPTGITRVLDLPRNAGL